MEQLILTCLEARLLMGQVLKTSQPVDITIEVIAEIRKVSPISCPPIPPRIGGEK